MAPRPPVSGQRVLFSAALPGPLDYSLKVSPHDLDRIGRYWPTSGRAGQCDPNPIMSKPGPWEVFRRAAEKASERSHGIQTKPFEMKKAVRASIILLL